MIAYINTDTTRDPDSQLLLARMLLTSGRVKEGEALLRQAAVPGHVGAMAELGQLLFLTPPPAPDAILEEGTKLLAAAALAGHAGAAHLSALIAAQDRRSSENWDRALDFAVRAAMAGHSLAQFELAFLSADRDAVAQLADRQSQGSEIWPRLRSRIDIAAFLSAPQTVKVLNTTPYVVLAEGFIPPAMCTWIMRRARPAMKKGKGYVAEPGAAILRTNSEVEYGFPELDLIHMIVRHRIADITGLYQGGLEPPSVFQYAPGEEFTEHCDYLDPDVPMLAAEIARTGQCVTTVLIYLNDQYEDGATEFVELGLKIKGKPGDALIFQNVDRNGAPDPRTRHAGRAPKAGEKWLFSQFIRNTRQANKLPG